VFLQPIVRQVDFADALGQPLLLRECKLIIFDNAINADFVYTEKCLSTSLLDEFDLCEVARFFQINEGDPRVAPLGSCSDSPTSVGGIANRAVRLLTLAANRPCGLLTLSANVLTLVANCSPT